MALSEVAKYYFDGHGKALRPVLTSTMASAVNQHLRLDQNDEVRYSPIQGWGSYFESVT